MLTDGMRRLIASYPKIYLACHRRHLRNDESGRKLTQHQASILDHLNSSHPLTISELARHLDVTESTMSIQVTRLERAGYVRRSQDDNDRRRIRASLTAAGLRVQEQNSVLDPDLVREMFSLLRPDETELGLAGLELLAHAAEKLMAKRALRRRGQTR
jgi:DNA-binding MarR family transcriptional regulator